MRQENPLGVILLIVLGLALLGVWNFSRSIGADFQVTLEALGRSAAVIGIAGGIWYFLRLNVMLLGVGTAAGLWPCWWKVLDSIANNGANPDKMDFRFPIDIWWNTNWFLYGVEATLIAAAVYLVIRRTNDPYAY